MAKLSGSPDRVVPGHEALQFQKVLRIGRRFRASPRLFRENSAGKLGCQLLFGSFA